MKIAVDKKAISNVVFTYLDKENLILYSSNKVSIKRDRRTICYEINDKNEILDDYLKQQISKLQISFILMKRVDVLLEIPFSFILEKKEITYSSYYFNEFQKSIQYPYPFSNFCEATLEILKNSENVNYDIGFQKEEESWSLLNKGNLPLNMSFFIKRLASNENYYEYFLFF